MTRDGIVTSIDVGTSKICTIIANVREGSITQILGMGIVPSHGIQKAIVVDINEPTEAIRESVIEAERSSGIRVKSAYVGITGKHINSFNRHASVATSRRDHKVTDKVLKQAIKSASNINLPEGRKLIHAIPRQYILDGQAGIKNPLGMHAYKLEVETHVITGGVSFIQNLVRCVQGVGIDVKDLILEPIADSEAVLEAGERESGVILADIGAGTTDIIVFRDSDIWHSSALPVGGHQVTRDLALGLGIPFNIAEELKRNYGEVMLPEEGNLRTINMGAAGNSISGAEVSYIIRARLTETLKMIFSDVPRDKWESWEPASLVLTGGTVNLPGTDMLGQEVLSLPVRVGRPAGIVEGAAGLSDPAYATGIGLLLWGVKYGGEKVSPPAGGVLRNFFSRLTRRFWGH